MPKDKSSGKKLADMMYGNPEGAAFGVFPQMKGKRSRQDPEAAKSFPVDLARGLVAGAVGMPGDIESLARLPYELITGNESPTFLPTSEDVLKRIPFGTNTPAGQFASGLGTLAGGSANIGAAPRMVKAAPGALKAAARDLSAPRTMGPEAGAVRIKSPGALQKASGITREGNPIQGAVVLIGDRMFMGRTHGDALNRAVYEGAVRKEGGKYIFPKGAEVNSDLFITNTGQIIDRYQALKMADIGASETAIEKGLMQNNPARSMSVDSYMEKARALKQQRDKFQAPQDEAMRLAQQRAALPVEQGGLGLPPDNTPEMRAKAMGFDTDTYHGSFRDITKFDPRVGSTESHAGRGIYSTDSPEDASLNYASIYGPDVSGRVERAMEDLDKDWRKTHSRMRDEVLTPRQQEIILQNTINADNLGVVYPLKVRSNKSIHLDAPEANPVRIGPFESYDEAADAYVDTPHTAKFNEALDEFRELGGEANPVYEVVQDYGGPVPARDVFNVVKKTGDEYGLYDPFTGEIVSGGVAAGDFVKHFGIDEIRHTPQFRNQQLNIGGEHIISLDPDNVRSRFAAFDPFRKDVATAAAMGVLAPDLLAKGKDDDKKKDKETKKAHGGRVHISDNPDVMALELAGGGLVKGLKAAAKAAKAGADAPKPIVEAPSIIIPGTISRVKEAVRESKGDYGAKRIERAADEIRNLEKLYKEQALRDAFGGDNAKALMTMNPADFEKYAVPLNPRFLDESSTRYTTTGERLSYPEYMENYLPNVGAFNDVPFLEINKKAQGTSTPPFISGHEGRHRSRVMTNRGDQAGLVRLLPRAELREPLPRRSQEEYIEALREELNLSDRLVRPESQGSDDDLHLIRSLIELPDIYAKGGEVSMAAGGISKLARLARAPAKSKQEIQAIAERIAPQVTGEYVRKDAKSAKTVAGKTQKQFQREKTLPVDVRPTTEERVPELVDIEKLKGDVMIGVPGDPTLTGKTLYGVGDFTLSSPSPQHGGPLYGLYSDDAFWASGIGPARGVQNLAKRASKQYDAPVKGSYIMMGPDSINYAQHFADANLQAIDLSRMTKAQIEQFNELIRQGSKKSGPRDSFPGIEDKESAYLHMAMDPELRKHFNALMQKPTVTEPLNLPSGTDIRFAITEPALRDLETGVTGFSMGRMRPDIPSKDLPLSTHPTYSHDIPGEFLGQSRFPVPYELSFPDTLQSIRANPKQARQEFGSLKMVGPRQIIDQQMIDEIKTYNEYMKRLTGKKKGGAVTKDEQSVQNPVHFTENPDAMRLALSKRN